MRLKSDIFLRWYATGKLFEEGRNLYDTRNGREVDLLVYGHDSGLGVGYYYPAHLTVLVGPLALLPYRVAHIVWTIAVQLFYVAGLALLVWHVGWPRTVNQITIFFVMAILFIPAVQHTIWGQFNTIGVLSFALAFFALQKGRFGWAGIWAVGLTFKPQSYVLVISFLLLWALSSRNRWRFFVAFAATSAFMWLIPALIQPTWMQDFALALGRYDQSVTVLSVIDRIWNPYQLMSAILVLATMLTCFRWRRSATGAGTFIGCLALTLAVWALVVPVVGMFHTLALIPAIILLLAGYKSTAPQLYSRAIIALLSVYFIGLLGFIIGLSRSDWYGFHVTWPETIYGVVLPIVMIVLTVPLVAPSWQPFVGIIGDQR
jgi:hypothetical protein